MANKSCLPCSPENHREHPWCWKSSVAFVGVISFISVTYLLFSTIKTPNWTYYVGEDRLAAHPPETAEAAAAAPNVPTNLSHIVFGIGASASTWRKRKGFMELWWRSDEMRGHVWLDSDPTAGREKWPASFPPFQVSRTNASRFGNRAAAARIASISTDEFRLTALPPPRWFVMGDDDTLFFPENLVAVLGRYDHEEMYYVGSPSESVEQDVLHSYGMAFGGGGFALSFPAAAELSHLVGNGCLDRYNHFYGSDQRVHACLAELGVPLTVERGFHQIDLRGDTYGLLAAHPVAPLVSLHHLGYLDPVIPGARNQLEALRRLAASYKVDPPRSLQQSFCYERSFNWSVSVSWGYSAQIYTWTAPPHVLEVPLRTFTTWRTSSAGPFTFNTRDLAHEDKPCERPARFFISSAVVGKQNNRTTTTEYARLEENERGSSCAAAAMVKTVRVVAEKMDPDEWKKSRRRHCCEAHTIKSWTGWSVEVRVHKCRPGEASTPP